MLSTDGGHRGIQWVSADCYHWDCDWKGSPQKKEKLSKHLDSVHECDELSGAESPVKQEPCQGFFGVKSYLHHFYEQVSVKNPQLYEEYEEYK